jgi:hypothetical protein
MVYIQGGGNGYQVVSHTAGVDYIIVDTASFDIAWDTWVNKITKP